LNARRYYSVGGGFVRVATLLKRIDLCARLVSFRVAHESCVLRDDDEDDEGVDDEIAFGVLSRRTRRENCVRGRREFAPDDQRALAARRERTTTTKTKILDVYDFTRANEYEKHVRVFQSIPAPAMRT
tara:strand:- start:124 stop:507 length:384 start_codon:yes stop_codon:yes gene_type:complete